MKLDLEAIEARCEAASEWLSCDGTYRVYMKFIAHARADIPALVAEVKRLRASLEAVLEEAESDLDRDIIFTECRSALAEPEEAT